MHRRFVHVRRMVPARIPLEWSASSADLDLFSVHVCCYTDLLQIEHFMEEGHRRIYLLGRLQIQDANDQILKFSARRIGALLACLVLRAPHAIEREELLARLWPEGDPEACRNRLRALLSNLRGHLEPGAAAEGTVLEASRANVRLVPSSFTSDYHDFLEAIRSASSATTQANIISSLERALALYEGELLVGYYDDWIVSERSRLADLRYQALRRLASHLAKADQTERALDYARQAVAAEPLDEEAHCDLMRLYGAIGQPSAALRQFEQLRRLLHEEMQATPSEEARRLAAEIEAKLGHASGQTKRSVRPMALRASERPPTATKRSNDLPVRLTSFFGREDEIAGLCKVLAPGGSARLVSVVGPGGTGKTRLSIEAAEQLSADYDGRVWFVSLADVLNSNDVGRAVAQALRLPPATGIDHLTQAIATLNQAPALLILDNMEQIVPDVAPQVEWLLAEVRSLRCLVTSRRSLGVEGEREIVLGPMPLPREEVGFERLSAYSGVALFVDRALAVRPDFALTAGNASDVVQLCHLLEGLPLAIELAAARTRVMTPGEMRTQTGKLIHWLVDVRGGKVARHRSLRATLEWSYRLLAPGDRRCFNALAVFVDGFTTEAAGAVALGERAETLDALAILEPLRDASMLSAVETAEATTRFGMLEMLRAFGLERLAESGEEAEVRARHLAYFADFVRSRVGLSTRWSPEELAQITNEDANLRAALEFGLRPDASPEQRRLVVDLASRLSRYWEVLGRLHEGRTYLKRVLALPETPETVEDRIQALRGAGVMSSLLGDHGEARILLDEGLLRSRDSFYRYGNAECELGLGNVAFAVGNYAEARTRYQDALTIYQGIEDSRGVATCLSELGYAAFFVGDHPEAERRLGVALELYRKADDLQGVASVLLRLGNVLRNQNKNVEARAPLDEALALFQDAGNKLGIGSTMLALGLAVGAVNQKEAQAHHKEALKRFREIGYRRGVSMCLMYLGWITLCLGDWDASLAYHREALELAQNIGDRRTMSSCLLQLSNLARDQGDEVQAEAHSTAALVLDREIGNKFGIALNLDLLGCLAIGRGDFAVARACISEAMEINRETCVPALIGHCLGSYARLALAHSEPVRAARLASKSASIRTAIVSGWFRAAEEQRWEEFVARIRAALDQNAFAAAWSEGEALSMDEAIAEAISGERNTD